MSIFLWGGGGGSASRKIYPGFRCFRFLLFAAQPPFLWMELLGNACFGLFPTTGLEQLVFPTGVSYLMGCLCRCFFFLVDFRRYFLSSSSRQHKRQKRLYAHIPGASRTAVNNQNQTPAAFAATMRKPAIASAINDFNGVGISICVP